MSGIAVIFWNLSDESVESASALLDFPHVESRMNRAQCTISALAPVRRSGLQPFFSGFAGPKTTKTCRKNWIPDLTSKKFGKSSTQKCRLVGLICYSSSQEDIQIFGSEMKWITFLVQEDCLLIRFINGLWTLPGVIFDFE